MEGEVEWNLPRADAISGNGHLTAGNGEKKEGRERVAWGKKRCGRPARSRVGHGVVRIGGRSPLSCRVGWICGGPANGSVRMATTR